MSDQNICGLSPQDHSYRQVIKGAVFFPLLKMYPENSELTSLAGKDYFQISYLDQWPASAAMLKQTKSLAPFIFSSEIH